MTKYKLLGGISVAALIGFFVLTPVYAADPILFGDASIVSGGNPGMTAQIRSDTGPEVDCGGIGCGGVTFTLPPDTSWSDLDTVSTDYNVTDDSCGGGSPRFQIKVDTNNDGVSDGNVHVAIGPSPSFTGCTTGWQNTGNIIGNEDTGRYDYSAFGGSPFTTYSNAPANVLAGEVISVQIVVDGSWNTAATGGDSEQTVLIDNTLINTDLHDFEPQPVGSITNPAADGDHVMGIVNFTATYNDGDEVNDDAVQWAIRQGTCAAGTGTVFGNVDGHSDPYTWDGSDFSATLDTSSLTPGNYCFVFNPTDDPGQNDVRLTRTFIVDANPFATPSECQGMTFSGAPIVGTNKSEVLNGTSGNDLIFALGGSDVVNGNGGNDCIVGGDGSDALRGNGGDDVILGGAASDSLIGGADNDKLYGGAGSDALRGEGGTDTLVGNAGSDSANGGGNTDTCDAEAESQCEL